MNTDTNRDRNLLFGVFAVQLRKVTPAQIMEAAGAWATDPSKDLSTRLSEQGAISPADREFLDRMVSEAIRAHGGDAAKTLQALGGADMVADSFHRSIVVSSDGLVSRAELGLNLLGLEDPILLKGVDEAPGRYTCESEHARGGMGRVLLVHDEYLGREIALKELLPGPDAQSNPRTPTPVRAAVPLMARFLQEARITGQLEHPSIVPVYELGHRLDGSLYYTMKLVRGRTLGQALAEAAGLEARLRLLPHFVDLCQAVAYAHSRRVIHRDIKPSNVMVGEFGETVVLDWGLAKVIGKEDIHADALATTIHVLNVGDSDSLAKTQYGQALGTPMYMPPEQAKGQIDQVDERSDVYSLGAVLYELLTGKPPFEGGTIKEILKQVIEDEPRAINALALKAPPELGAIAMRALDKDPRRRYQSTSDLAEEVQRFQSGALVKAYEYKMSEYLRRFAKRHRTAIGTAVAGLAAVLVVSAVYATDLRRTIRELGQANDNLEASNQDLIRAREQAERSSYVSGIRLAASQMEQHNTALARATLLATPEGLRNWEWGYLYKNIDQSLLTLAEQDRALLSALFSPDGRRIVTASSGGNVNVWDATNGTELPTNMFHSDVVQSAAFSPDGTRVVTASNDKTAKVWDQEHIEIAPLVLIGHKSDVNTAAFSSDGERIVTASSDRTAKVWDAATGRELMMLTGHQGILSSAAFSPDGTRIFTASSDKTAKIWDAATGRELLTLNGHQYGVNSAAYSPDGARIVTASADSTAKVWDAASGQEILTLGGHRYYVNWVSYSPDGARIVTASGDSTAKVWDAATGRELMTLTGHQRIVLSAAFSPDGTRIVTTSYDKTTKLWDATLGPDLQATPVSQDDGLRILSFSPDYTRMVGASKAKSSAMVWDVASGEELQTLASHQNILRSVDYSPDGTRIVTASEDHTAKIWDAESGQELLTLTGHLDFVLHAVFNRDGTRIVTASGDQTAKIWDAATGRELMTLTGHKSEVLLAAFSPDGTRIVTTSNDKTAKLWDTATGRELLTLARQPEVASSVAFSPDGGRIVIARYTAGAKVWDAVTGRELLTLKGQAGLTYYANFSPDGTRIVTSSDDMRIWDAVSGEELLTLPGLQNARGNSAFSPDGMRIITSHWDGRLKLWAAAEWRPEAWLEDDRRAELIRLSLRQPPTRTAIRIDPAEDEATVEIAELREMSNLWMISSGSSADRTIRNVQGQGIFVSSAMLFPGAPRVNFQDGDLITRINTTSVDALPEAGRLISEWVDAYSSNMTTPRTLYIETLNRYERKWQLLEFPGLVENKLHFDRRRILQLLNLASGVIQQNIKNAETQGTASRTQTLSVAQMAGPFQLDAQDELVSLNAKPIEGFPSLLAAFNEVREQIEKGTLTTTKLITHRPSTDQYFRTTFMIDPDTATP